MDNTIIILSQSQFNEYLRPILQKLEQMETHLSKNNAKNASVYSDAEAAKFLKCSTKKLQTLRNNREIGFIRENGGRKIRYRHEHLMEYLTSHELKKRKQNANSLNFSKQSY
jgi:excisionase family DNA binding protein